MRVGGSPGASPRSGSDTVAQSTRLAQSTRPFRQRRLMHRDSVISQCQKSKGACIETQKRRRGGRTRAEGVEVAEIALVLRVAASRAEAKRGQLLATSAPIP